MCWGDQRKVQICESLLIKHHVMVHRVADTPEEENQLWDLEDFGLREVSNRAKLHLRREKGSKLQLQTTEDKIGVSEVYKYI